MISAHHVMLVCSRGELKFSSCTQNLLFESTSLLPWTIAINNITTKQTKALGKNPLIISFIASLIRSHYWQNCE